MGDKIDKVKGAASKIAQMKRRIVSIVKFFTSAFGQVVFWIIVILLAILLLYILANTLANFIKAIFGIEDPGLKYTADYEVLRQLANSGYESLMDPKELQDYLAFEYAVLMDAARMVQDTGVHVYPPKDLSPINVDELSDQEWAELVAANMSKDTKKIREVEEKIGKTQLEAAKKKLVEDGITLLNEIRNDFLEERENALREYNDPTPGNEERKGKAYEEYMEATKKISEIAKDMGEGGLGGYIPTEEQSLVDVETYVNSIIRKYRGERERNLTNADSCKELYFKVAENENSKSLIPYLRIYKSASINRYYIFDGKNNTIVNSDGTINTARIEELGFASRKAGEFDDNNADHVAFALDIKQNGAYNINVDLNAENEELWKNSKEPGLTTKLDMFAEYEKDQLFYEERDNGSATYEIPFKVLVDRFMPKATLFSSWYMLKDSTNGGKVDELLEQMKDIYNAACLNGEKEEPNNSYVLLKKVIINKDLPEYNIKQGEQEVLKSYFNDLEQPTRIRQEKYVPLFDERNLGETGDVNVQTTLAQIIQNAQKIEGGDIAAEMLDDLKLAFSYLTTENKTLLNDVQRDIMLKDAEMLLEKIKEEYEAEEAEPEDTEEKPEEKPDPEDEEDIKEVKFTIYKTDENGKYIISCNALESGHHLGTARHDGSSNSHELHDEVCNQIIANEHVGSPYGSKYESCYVPLLEVYSKLDINSRKIYDSIDGTYKSATVKVKLRQTTINIPGEGIEFSIEQIEEKDIENNLTNEFSFIEFERMYIEMNGIGDWVFLEDKAVEFNPITDLVYATDLGATTASAKVNNNNARLVNTSTNKTVTSVPISSILQSVMKDMAESGGEIESAEGESFTLVKLEGNGIIKDPQNLKPIEYPSQEKDIRDVSSWYYARTAEGKKCLYDVSDIERYIASKIRPRITTYIETKLATGEFKLVDPSTGDDLLNAAGQPVTKISGYISVGNVDVEVPEPKQVFTFETIQFGIIQEVSITKMPMYLPKWVSYWSREIDFVNYLTTKGRFNPNSIQHLIPSGNPYDAGYHDLQISVYDKWRTDLYSPIFENVRENDVIAMLSEWENVERQGVFAANQIIRDTYKLINFAKEEEDENGKAYLHEDAYKYINIPDEVLNFDETTTELRFWMDHFMSSVADPIEPEENITMRTKLEIMSWQNVDYKLYPECYNEETDKYQVYALWPEGGYMAKSHYAISANAEGPDKNIDPYSSNEVIESWGGWKYNGRHAGVDLYGRTTASTLLNTFASQIKSKLDGDKVVLTNAAGESLASESAANAINSEAFEALAAADTGLYRRGATVTLELDGKKYTFPGTAAAIYGYELYRLTKALGNASVAERTLADQLNTETSNTPIISIAPGIVKQVRASPGGGFSVQVAHTTESEGTYSTYLHMKRWPLVQVGQYVGAGTVLGYEGTTGRSRGVHLHFEVAIADEGEEIDIDSGISAGGTNTVSKGEFPVPYLYPFFTPFYNADKVDKDNVDMSDEHMSLLRTVYPYSQKIGSNIERMTVTVEETTEDGNKVLKEKEILKPIDCYMVPERRGYTLNQVSIGENDTVEIKNYVPTRPLLADASLLPTFDDDELTDGIKRDATGVARYATVLTEPYNGKDVKASELYFDEAFMDLVSKMNGYIYTGILPYVNYIYDMEKPLLGDGGFGYTAEQWKQYEYQLYDVVQKAGYGSRAGVVAAARFLAGMPFSVPYLGQQFGGTISDVGIYAKVGLNPTWGTKVTCGGRIFSRNGFDCTGYVNWCLINGGVKPAGHNSCGDAGDEHAIYQIGNIDAYCKEHDIPTFMGCVVSTIAKVTDEEDFKKYLARGNKIGDEVCTHVAIVIGEDREKNILYLAEEQGRGLRIIEIKVDEVRYTSGSNRIITYSPTMYTSEGNMDLIKNKWYDIKGKLVGEW